MADAPVLGAGSPECGFKSHLPHHVEMDYAPFKIPSHSAGDFSYRSVIPPFRKKSRFARLLSCKRPRGGSLSLPTFCGYVGSNYPQKNRRSFLSPKFDPYLFDTENAYKHGKQKMFESWGYSIDDSQWLQKEFEKQALDKYVSGEYTLGKLNKDGQRISIRVEIPRKDKQQTVSFVTGWMVYPNGQIQMTTPYGGD